MDGYRESSCGLRCVVVAFEGEAAEASSGGFRGGGLWVVGRGEGVGHLGGERLGVLVMGVLVMDEVLYEVLYGGMEWMVRMDVMLMLMLMLIVKRKSIHFYRIWEEMD